MLRSPDRPFPPVHLSGGESLWISGDEFPVALRNPFQAEEVGPKWRPQAIPRGRPCNLYISLATIRARPVAVLASLGSGMKCAIFVNRSMTTHSSLQPFDISVTKSMWKLQGGGEFRIAGGGVPCLPGPLGKNGRTG